MQAVKPELSRWRQLLLFFLLILGLFGLQLGELDPTVRDVTAWLLTPSVQVVEQSQRFFRRLNTMSLLLREGSSRLALSEYALAQCQVDSDRQAILEHENALLREALGQKPEGTQTKTFQFYGSGEIWFINGGTDSGVEPGDVVTWEGSLVGEVSEAFARHSRVRTLMDQSWQIPVQVGTASASKALLSQAHGYPEIILIPKTAPLQDEDMVSTAGDQDLPPGIPIGRVENIQEQADGATKKAFLQLFQSPRNINLVEIVSR